MTSLEVLENLDYESLKSRAERLTKNSSPSDINLIIKDSCDLDATSQHKIRVIIKEKAGVPYCDQRTVKKDVQGKNERDHLCWARLIVEKIGYGNILTSEAHVWLWGARGIWSAITDRELKRAVQKIIEDEGETVTRSLIDNVCDVLKSETFKPQYQWNIKQEAINMPNGELHWNNCNWELRPHLREDYQTTQIPVIYDPHAQCPRFNKFLEEIFAGDADSNDKCTALLEMIGYTLTCSTRYERFLILIGAGANGKSIVLDIVRMLVGQENVAAVQPSQLSNKFQRAYLHLKLANLVTEMAIGDEIADAELKSITSGELITAEHKNKDPFSFRPYVTCWFGTNHMPHTKDFSNGLFRRALIIPFNNVFKQGVNADPQLKDKLATELSGILNLALQAYGEALKRNSFIDPESSLLAKAEWKLDTDHVAQFVEEKCELVPNAQISSSELYSFYKFWAEEVGIIRTLNRKNFSSRIVRCGGLLCRGTNGVRRIAGIQIKE